MPSKAKNSAKIWFIKNTPTEGPGYLSDLALRWKIPFQICDLQKGDPLPKLKSKDVAVVLGGPMSANDKTKSMRALLKWIRALLKRKIHYFGICLGLQTLVKAAGGRVIKSPVKEVGLKMKNGLPYQCKLTRVGKSDPLFNQFPPAFPIFQLHGETVMLKKGMVLIAESKGCRNQVVRVRDHAYGFQGHLEITRPLLKEWLMDDLDLRKINARALLKDWGAVEKKLRFCCRDAFWNFLKIANVVD